jgi:membrane-bound metal-dependent hydrolase YbcI (DUF457 family)
MPFTPFHLGPALLIGLILYRYVDLPTLLIASVIVDIRTALVFFGIIDGPLHGFLHTFLGGTILAFMLIGSITPFREMLQEKMDLKGFLQQHDDGTIVGAAFLGVFLHLAMDAMIYSDMTPFWPLMENPLLNTLTHSEMYTLCVLTGLVGLSVIPWRVDIQTDQEQNTVEEDEDEDSE